MGPLWLHRQVQRYNGSTVFRQDYATLTCKGCEELETTGANSSVFTTQLSALAAQARLVSVPTQTNPSEDPFQYRMRERKGHKVLAQYRVQPKYTCTRVCVCVCVGYCTPAGLLTVSETWGMLPISIEGEAHGNYRCIPNVSKQLRDQVEYGLYLLVSLYEIWLCDEESIGIYQKLYDLVRTYCIIIQTSQDILHHHTNKSC